MKFRFPNGCPISLWAEEFTELTVTAHGIKYLTPRGQWTTIEVPPEWTRISRDSTESKRDADSPPSYGTPTKTSLAKREKNNLTLQSNPGQPRLTDSSLSELRTKVIDLTAQVEKFSQQNTKELELIEFKLELQGLKEQVNSTSLELAKAKEVLQKVMHTDAGGQDCDGVKAPAPESQKKESNPRENENSKEPEKRKKSYHMIDVHLLQALKEKNNQYQTYDDEYRRPWQTRGHKKQSYYKYGGY